jgi:hypothetical protein
MTIATDYAPPVSSSKQRSSHGWISRQTAAEVLDVSLQTIDRYVSKGWIAKRTNTVTRAVTLSAEDVEHLRKERAGELPE